MGLTFMAMAQSQNQMPRLLPEWTPELRFAMIIALVSMVGFRFLQSWLDGYTQKHSNEMDDMLCRMFWNQRTSGAQSVYDVSRRVLKVKIGLLVVVVIGWVVGLYSISRNSFRGSFAVLFVIVSLAQVVWTYWRDQKKKEAEEDAKKSKLLEFSSAGH